MKNSIVEFSANKFAFEVGMSAVDMICNFIKSVPRIMQIQLVNYFRRDSSDEILNYVDLTEEREIGVNPRWIRRNELSVERLEKEIDDTVMNVAVASKLMVEKSRRVYLPMLDLECDQNEENEEKIQEFQKVLNNRMGFNGGLLLDSGNSYHYYGLTCLAKEEWLNFFNYSELVLGNLLDLKFIPLARFKKNIVLRVSPKKEESSLVDVTTPRLIEIL